jgi:uridylate kinase
MFHRVIIKISGEALAGGGTSPYDNETARRVAREVLDVMKSGVEAAVVVGGGNLWRGRAASPDMDKVKADQIGMTATIMNGIFFAETFRLEAADAPVKGVVVMTPFDVNNFTRRFSIEEARRCLAEKILPVFAGGTGHPFFSTDSAVAIRACELRVDAVLFGKSVNGVYDGDPKTNPTAKLYKTVSYETVLAKNLYVADISATALLAGEKIPGVVFGLDAPGGIAAACAGRPIGGTKIGVGLTDEYYV